MNPDTRSSAGSPRAAGTTRTEAALRQELRRLQRHALLSGAPSAAERERIAQLRNTIKRMDADRFAAREPVQ